MSSFNFQQLELTCSIKVCVCMEILGLYLPFSSWKLFTLSKVPSVLPPESQVKIIRLHTESRDNLLRIQHSPKTFLLLLYATAGNCTGWAVLFPPLLPRPEQVSPAFSALPLLTVEADVLRNADRERMPLETAWRTRRDSACKSRNGVKKKKKRLGFYEAYEKTRAAAGRENF